MFGCQWHRFQGSVLVRPAEGLRLGESWPVALEVSVGLTIRVGMPEDLAGRRMGRR